VRNKIYIAGQQGMVGNAIIKLVRKKKYKIINCYRKDLDLINQAAVEEWFKKNKPDIVINAAGRVGGILDNFKFIDDYIYINTMIGFNLLNCANKYGVKRFINLGSACIYPREVRQPIKESYLLSSKLEKTNEGYALAKISTLKYCEYLNQKYNKNFTSLQPANLYGEGDNFDLKSSHVIPALIRKFHTAKVNSKKKVEVWGSGNVKREFLNVDDLASAIYFVIKKKENFDFMNVGGGEHYSIKKIAFLIKRITKYQGKIVFNKDYPDGVKQRQLNSKLIRKLGWKPKIKLRNGLIKYCQYYEKKILPKETTNS